MKGMDPLAYNIGLIGESGIGKSTVMKEVCEKLAGKDGYMALDVGKECGHDAIHGMFSEAVPDWNKFEEVVDDIVENKFTDYPELRAVIIDTLDQLFEITEPKVIRMHNLANPEKKADSIKGAFGGFGGGEDKVIELILTKIWELRSVGVSVIVIGHTKKRNIEDVVTGNTYSTLTTNMSQRYFNAIKTKLHVLGVAYIDRKIVQEKTGKKNIVTKQEEVKGKIVSESRQIAFRDDSFSIDSKSRFAHIVESIPLDADAFIQALRDAIACEHSKSGKSLEETAKEQQVLAEAKAEQIKKESEEKKNRKAIAERNAELIACIQQTFAKADAVTKKAVKEKMAEYGFSSFRDEDIPTRALEEITSLLKKE